MKKLFSAICALVLIFGASISGVFTASCTGLPGSSGLSGSGSSSGSPSASGGSGVAGERLINSVVLVNFAGEESFDEEKKANVKSVFSEGENSLGSYVSFISLGRTSVVTEIVGEVTLGFSADYFTPAYAYSTDDAAYVRINENGYDNRRFNADGKPDANGAKKSADEFLRSEELVAAANEKITERKCFDYRNKYRKAYDLQLIKEINKFPCGDYNFIIFHGMGQHQEYNKRFGKSDVRFTAGNYPSRHDLTVYEKQIIADYDNATLYNDRVVKQLCERFKNDDAVVIYLPDHGEEVFDRIHSYGRDHNADVSADIAFSEFEVPFEIWFSPRAKKEHSDIYNAARKAVDKAFSTDDLPHLLMGIAGISSPLYDARRDLLNPTFNDSRKRILKRTVDYDSLMTVDRKLRKTWRK